MPQRLLLVLFLTFITSFIHAQQFNQTVRGTVLDLETKFPLPGAVIRVYRDSSMIGGAAADEQGKFTIANIPTGRISVVITYTGYAELVFSNLVLSSAKELVLNVEMEQHAIEVEEVVIRVKQEGDAINEMATVSARQFSIDETNRYAGSRGDPARMASNFAGVQGADDSRNDIVIRGNSPQGVLWRVEGVDIPNPNHFNIPGTAGGPVSIINNKYLANSDFYTGAFPAEYGNSTAGVFDLRLRNGNNQKHEVSGQFGFLGTELFAEGPLNKAKGSSYLVSYRYSSLQLFSALGIDIGTDAVPHYQDGAFRLNFPGKKNSALSVWGIGGISSVDILISKQTSPEQRNIYGQNDRDQHFGSGMGIVGLTWSKSLNEKTFLKSTLSASRDRVSSFHELVYRHLNSENLYEVDSMKPLLRYEFATNKYSHNIVLNKKISPTFSLRLGYNADLLNWSMADSVRIIDTTQCDYYSWRTRWNNTDLGILFQPYAQLKWKANDKWTVTAGIHNQVLAILTNEKVSHASLIEPRIGVKFSPNGKSIWSFGVGRHSQMQPSYMYFYAPPNVCDSASKPAAQINRKMDFTYSHHIVMGYQRILGKHMRVLSEVYFQYLNNVPVETVSSSFSLLNTGSGFSRFFPGNLSNTGTGRNYGAELTVERFFHNGWLALFTASVFDAKYKGSDGVLRNTDFNGHYAFNALSSKEWKTGENSSFTTGIKITTTGGRYYGPADVIKSNQQREIVFVDSLRNTLQFPSYFRLDLKLNYRLNRAKTAHEIGIDLVNVLNTKNVLSLTYAPDENNDPNTAIRKEYQLGFLPLFYYKIDFKGR